MSLNIPQNCHDCPLSETRRNIVRGEGPVPCDFMFVGQNPGKWENLSGKPFVEKAKAGRELSWLLNRNGFLRSEVYLTNAIKCHAPNDRDPRPEEVEACAKWLDMEVELVNPKYIVAIGAYSTRHFLGDVALEVVHGIPFSVDERTVIPIYHVASGFHAPETMLRVHLDMRAVAEIVKGSRPARHIEDEYAGREEYYVLEDSDL
jgi:uracil-DNA glycosylase family 4